MADYNTIRGLRVRYLSAEPSNPEDGQVWYNSTTGNLRVDGIAVAGSWASGGAAPRGLASGSLAGVQTSAMMWGGDTGGAPPGWPLASYSYNGTSWTGAGDIPSPVRATTGQFGAGAPTAAAYGGFNTPGVVTIEYNGSAWGAGGSLNDSREYAYNTGGGTQTAGIAIGGGPSQAVHEHYNGTAWTQKTSFPSGANSLYAIGSQGATLGVSGGNGTTASWDGSAWTGSPVTLGSPRDGGAAGGSSSTNGYVFGGGSTPTQNNTTFFNGTSWAANPTMANNRSSTGGTGIQSNALLAGSFYNGNTAVEEFTAPSVVAKNVSVS